MDNYSSYRVHKSNNVDAADYNINCNSFSYSTRKGRSCEKDYRKETATAICLSSPNYYGDCWRRDERLI